MKNNNIHIIQAVTTDQIIHSLSKYNLEPTVENINRVVNKLEQSTISTDIAVYFLFPSNQEAQYNKAIAENKQNLSNTLNKKI